MDFAESCPGGYNFTITDYRILFLILKLSFWKIDFYYRNFDDKFPDR